MNKITFIAFIIVFLIKTGTVFSSSSIFDVDNIIIKNDGNQTKEKILDTAFQRGFEELMRKILQKKDATALTKTNLKDIKKLISSYQIIENKDLEKKQVSINLSFDRKKINSFFYSKNISYADISKTKVVLFPVLIKDNSINIYSNNYFYENWNPSDTLENKEFINYVLPVEDLEDIVFLEKNKDNLEEIEIKEILSNYDITNYIFLVIRDSGKKIDIFLKGIFGGKEIIKNFNIIFNENDENNNLLNTKKAIKEEINEIWKSQNLIDIRTPSFLNIFLDIKKQNDLLNLQKALNKIDLIESYQVLELNKNYAKIKIKYLGKIDKMKNKFNNQGIKVTISNEEWKLELI